MYVKKISEKEFARRVINKEMEIAGGPIFDTIEEMSAWQKKEGNRYWFSDYSFKSKEEFSKWKEYFNSEFYNCFPKRMNRKWRDRYFSEFNFMYGLKLDFDYTYDELLVSE